VITHQISACGANERITGYIRLVSDGFPNVKFEKIPTRVFYKKKKNNKKEIKKKKNVEEGCRGQG